MVSNPDRLARPTRRWLTVLFVVGCVVAAVVGEGHQLTQERILTWFFVQLPLFAWWASEPEVWPGGRHPAQGWRSRLAAPWVPGGGRAAALLSVHAAIGFAVFITARARALALDSALDPSGLWADDDPFQFALAVAYACTWVLLPTWAVSRWLRPPVAQPVGVCAAVAWLLLLPFLLPGDAGSLDAMFGKVRRDGTIPDGYGVEFAWAFGLGALALALNLPRIVRGLGFGGGATALSGAPDSRSRSDSRRPTPSADCRAPERRPRPSACGPGAAGSTS